MQRKYPLNPIVAVGGVVYKNRRILLSKRKDPPDELQWSIPGGAVEKGESLFDALKREIREECGILISEGIPFLILDKIYKKDHKIIYHYVIIDFLIKKFSGSLHTGSDSIDLKFFDLEDLSDISKSVSKLREYLELFLLNGKLTYLSFKE